MDEDGLYFGRTTDRGVKKIWPCTIFFAEIKPSDLAELVIALCSMVLILL